MDTPKAITPESIAKSIGAGTVAVLPRHLFSKKNALLAGAVLVVLVGAGLLSGSGAPKVTYTTEAVSQGNLVVRVSATGNLQPTTEVQVGSELSGIIDAVLVNDNDKVTKDQELARLDTSKLEDQVNKSEASLNAAKASVDVSKAGVLEAKTNLERLQEAWKISGGKVPSKSELTTAQAAYDRAVANEASAAASVGQAEASLRSDQTNMAKAVIRSPIDGVVLLRSVEPGQTVAASLQAPVLFTLAQDLMKMELNVDIDEADVGSVKEGQDAEFTVDAYADRTYPAKITRVRFGSETTNGVVTYQGVLEVNNEDLSLRPGMTATATITTTTRDNVLLVPNAALRFTPETVDEKKASVVSALIPHGPAGRAKTARIVAKGSDQTVWVLRDGAPAAVSIKTGATDGRLTEVVSGDLKAGDAVVIDSVRKAK